MPCQTSGVFVPSVHRLLGIGSEIIKYLLIQKFFYFYFTGIFFLFLIGLWRKVWRKFWFTPFSFIFTSRDIKGQYASKISVSSWALPPWHYAVDPFPPEIRLRSPLISLSPSTQTGTLIPEIKECLKGSCPLKQTILNLWNSKRKFILLPICCCETSISFRICGRYSHV